MVAITLPDISDAHKHQYREKGYFILENALSDADLALLRENCADALEHCHAEMDALGTDVLELTHRGNRYFLRGHAQRSAELRRFLLGSEMETICRETIGETAYLFFEQFVVKAPEKGMVFGWHQDGGYVQVEHRPFITCWIALDDVNEENGTVSLIPLDEMERKEVAEHVREEGTNDLIGYSGDHKGIPAIMAAGSILVFSSMLFHRSGVNRSASPRRVFIGHYAPHVLLREDGTRVGFAVPILENGQRSREETGPPPESEAWRA